MNAIITNDGLLIPNEWLFGFGQFDIFRTSGLIVIKSDQLSKAVHQPSKRSLPVAKPITTNNSAVATPIESDYTKAMQSYLSRHAQPLSTFSQPYPKREELYDRVVFLR